MKLANAPVIGKLFVKAIRFGLRKHLIFVRCALQPADRAGSVLEE